MIKSILFTLNAIFLLTACSKTCDRKEYDVSVIVDSVWVFSQTHPDGFTLNILTMTEPTEGIVVSFAATQGSHSREQLDAVVEHALEHDGYIGGWLNTVDSLYYFDSNRLFPEDSLEAALRFAKENEQQAVFILSTMTDISVH